LGLWLYGVWRQVVEKSLRSLKRGETGLISRISAESELGRRIRDLGLVKGAEIEIIGEAPLYDPIAVRVNDSVLTLRNREADFIYIERE